ncbi:Auxin responsive SAUR protein, partial [Cynara cardunculus var. scolymus]
MISPKKLARITRKWQNLAALKCKKMAVPRAADCGCSATIVDKGCFVVYTCDEIRFVVPLEYLKNEVFQEVLEIAEQEYGSQSDGPIRLPFKATFMQYMVSLIERQMCKDVEEEFRTGSITSWRCLSTSKLPKKLIRMATLRQKRFTFPRAANGTTRGIDKGHFTVYTSDEIRLVMPLCYLKNEVFLELLKVAEDEYGLQIDGPIRLPFEATFMEYMISLTERCVCNDLEKTLLMSIITSERWLSNSNIQLEQSHPQ